MLQLHVRNQQSVCLVWENTAVPPPESFLRQRFTARVIRSIPPRLAGRLLKSSLPRMHNKAVTRFIILATVLCQSVGELVNVPQNTESRVGDTTYFNCSTNLKSKDILWKHGLKYIYTGDTILDPYRGRFEIDRNASVGSHNLVIHSVEPGDAGEYICIDDDGHGATKSAELIVLETDPDCQSNIRPDGVIGQNIFNIPPDEFTLTCNVSYHGRNPPKLEWKKFGYNSFIKVNVSSNVTSNYQIIYTLTLTGDVSLDNSSYVCQTTRSRQGQYKCNSEAIKVLYFAARNKTELNVFRGGEITCIIGNNTFPCISQWYHGNRSCPLSCDETITTHLLGEYLCTAKCQVRGEDYYFDALKAVVAEAPTTVPPSKAGTIAASVVVPIVVIMLVVLCSVYTVKNNKRKKNKKILRQIHEIKSEVQKAEWLVTMNSIHNIDEEISAKENNIAAEEIELLFKIKTEETSEGKAILGSAILDGELFLVLEESSILEAYKCNDFNSMCRRLMVKEVTAAFDICSCKKNKFLYIINMNSTMEVIKITPTGEFVSKWSTKDNVRGFLSASTEGNLIISVQDKHMLLEYSPDGKLEREIKLGKRINPWHAIKLETDFYIVSHGTLFDPLHRVCRVDKKGKVHESFGRQIGSTATQLNMPVYLAAGSEGCVIVADLCNHRVLLLDLNLNFKKILVPKYKQRFRSPRRICIDEGLLVVVIGLGIPQKEIYVEPDTVKETESMHSSTKTAYSGANFSNEERGEVVKLLGSDDPKEAGDTMAEGEVKETEPIQSSMKTMHSGAHFSRVATGEIVKFLGSDDRKEKGDTSAGEEEDMLVGKYCSKENVQLVSQDSQKENGEGDAKNWIDTIDRLLSEWKKRLKVVDVPKRIEGDCRLLVFDMNPLLQSG